MNKKIIFGVILFALGIVGYKIYQVIQTSRPAAVRKFASTSQGNQQQVRSVPGVRAAHKRIVPQIETYGTARADEAVVISANVTEQVRELRFDDGHQVQKGAVIAVLSSEKEQADLERAEKVLQERASALGRTQKLFDQKVASKAALDEDQRLYAEAEGSYESLKADLGDRLIRAPFAGILGLRNISVGRIVRPGDRIATLDAIDRLKIDFSISARHVPHVRLDQTILLRTRAYPKEVFRAKIISIDPRMDADTRSVLARAVIDNADHRLRPGMFFDVNVTLEEREILALPEISVLSRGDEKFVFLVGAEGVLEKRAIKTDLLHDGFYSVVSGLDAGDIVVYEGAQLMREGMRVKVTLKDQSQ